MRFLKQKRKEEQKRNGNGAAADELGHGVMLCLDTCPIRKDRNERHKRGGNIKTEIKKQEDRTCGAAAVCAELDVQSLIEDKDEKPRKEILKTDQPHRRRCA